MDIAAQTLLVLGIALLGASLVGVAGASTAFRRTPPDARLMPFARGSGAGIAIAIVFQTQIVSGTLVGRSDDAVAAIVAAVSFVLGAAIIAGVFAWYIDPRSERSPRPTGAPTPLRKSTLGVVTAAIYNAPLGLTLGLWIAAAHGAALDPSRASGSAIWALFIAVALRNVVSGFGIAAPLREYGVRSSRAFWYTIVAGSIQPAAGLIGIALGLIAPALIPAGHALSAGAILTLIVGRVVPQIHDRSGAGWWAALTLAAWFAAAMMAFRIVS